MRKMMALLAGALLVSVTFSIMADPIVIDNASSYPLKVTVQKFYVPDQTQPGGWSKPVTTTIASQQSGKISELKDQHDYYFLAIYYSYEAPYRDPNVVNLLQFNFDYHYYYGLPELMCLSCNYLPNCFSGPPHTFYKTLGLIKYGNYFEWKDPDFLWYGQTTDIYKPLALTLEMQIVNPPPTTCNI